MTIKGLLEKYSLHVDRLRSLQRYLMYYHVGIQSSQHHFKLRRLLRDILIALLFLPCCRGFLRITHPSRPLLLVCLRSNNPHPHSHPASTARSRSLISGIETEGIIFKTLSCIAGTSDPSKTRFTLPETSSDASSTNARSLLHSAL